MPTCWRLFSSDSSLIRVLDVRQPGQALLELRGHGAPVNCLEWSNTQRGVLASGGDDCCVLLWDLVNSTSSSNAPTMAGGIQQGQVQGGTGQERGPSASWNVDTRSRIYLGRRVSKAAKARWAYAEGEVSGACSYRKTAAAGLAEN